MMYDKWEIPAGGEAEFKIFSHQPGHLDCKTKNWIILTIIEAFRFINKVFS